MMKNRVIPYEMVLDSISSTRELVERILPKGEIESLKIGAKCIEGVVQESVEKANEGAPVIGHHFSFQREYLYCFDCVPVCIEGTSYLLSALLPDGVERYYDLMANWGHPFHTCTSQKGAMGMTLDDLFEFDKKLYNKMMDLKRERFGLKETIKKLDDKFNEGIIDQAIYFKTFKNLQKEVYLIDKKIKSLTNKVKNDKSLRRRFNKKGYYS